MARIDELLQTLHDQDGSDLHLVAGLEPRIRQGGELKPVEGWEILTASELKTMLRELAPPDQWAAFERSRDADFAYGLSGVARFRVNYFWQHRGMGAVMRIIPEEIRSLEELNCPQVRSMFTSSPT